jgi:hypothetical protein
MMYEELYQYLVLHKQLQVPGVGTFLVERKPATGDFPNKKIEAPAYAVAWQPVASTPSKKFFNWMAAALNSTDRDAVVRFNDFAFDLKKQIASGATINWNGIGILSTGFAGAIKFSPAADICIAGQPVVAEKVIREMAEHTVRVGEDEKTSGEMIEMLHRHETKIPSRRTYAFAAFLLVFLFLSWYFSKHGLAISSAANTQKFIPQEAPATYRLDR